MLGLLAIIAVGFFLGMRHATDPDHVIVGWEGYASLAERNWR